MGVRIPTHMDIQDHFVIPGTNGHADAGAMAALTINPTYAKYKNNFDKELHDTWHRRHLVPKQIHYAAKDAHVCYAMYCTISIMRAHLTPSLPNRPPLRENLIMPY
jgi:hypothetical protein